MGKKRVLTMATEEYVNELLSQIKLIEGKSAYQLAVENGFVGTKEEWLLSLKGETGIFDMEKIYEALDTNDKSVLGAINELHTMVNEWMNPVYDIKSQMYYGVINPTVFGGINSYYDITLDMLTNSANVKSTKPGERIINLGNISEGMCIVVAIPTLFDFIVNKDNGFGGKMLFDETFLGANGIDVEYNGIDYRLYGEFTLVNGERLIYIEQGIPDDCDCCDCETATDEDIDKILNGLDESDN